jgi:hypothetical protein
MNFTQIFKAARSVSTPLIAVRTPDPASTIRSLSVAAAELAKALKEPEPAVLTHDVANGLKAFNDEGKKTLTKLLGTTDPKSLAAPPNFLKAINKPATDADKTLVDALIFMANGHRFWNDPLVMQALWNLRDTYKQMGATLVIMATFGAVLPPELTQDVLIIDEPLPTEAELGEIVKDSFKAAQNYLPKLKKPTEPTLDRAVSALVGLAAYPAEQTTAMCIGESGLNLDDLWERKRQVIEQVRGFSVWRGGEKFADLGGLENAKRFFSQMMNGPERPDGVVFTDEIEKIFAGFGTDSSGTTTKSVGALLSYMEDRKIAGSLFLGPAGSGKSALAKALGNEAGIPTVSADWAAMETSLVGATGENIRAALAIITAMFKRPLFIATCNSFGALPPELRRRYWLPTLFFDLPRPEERQLIWPIHIKASGLKEQKLPPDDQWTGAEIRNCCNQARILGCTLIEAASYVVPIAISAAEKVRELRTQAAGKFISAAEPGLYRYDGDAAPTTTTGRRIRKLDADVLTGSGQA